MLIRLKRGVKKKNILTLKCPPVDIKALWKHSGVATLCESLNKKADSHVDLPSADRKSLSYFLIMQPHTTVLPGV